MVELIIFDCDGVLIDSEVLCSEVSVELLGELGLPVPLEEYTRLCAGHAEGDLRYILRRRYDFDLPVDYWPILWERLRTRFVEELRPIPGVHDLLDQLMLPKCVASNSEHDRLLHALEITSLRPFFEQIFSVTMVERAKPAPDLFQLAAKKMGAQPSKTLVIEDSPAGVQAAVSAGMRVIGFVGGSHAHDGTNDELRALGAEAICSSMEEVENLLP